MATWDNDNGSIGRDAWTSNKKRIRRLQVDVGNTGFFDNREMRYFRELSIPSGESRWTRVTVDGGNFGIILRLQALAIDQGAVRFRAWRDVTLTGATWAEPQSPDSGLFYNNNLPSAPEFAMSTAIENSYDDGVTATGGTVAESLRLRSSGATAQKSAVSQSVIGERGIAPGVYYLQFENLSNDTALGVYDLIFEERLGQG